MAGQVGRSHRKKTLRQYGFFVAIAALVGLLLLQSSDRVREEVEPTRTAVSDQLFVLSAPSVLEGVGSLSVKDRRILELEEQVRDLSRYKAIAITMAERMDVYQDILNLQGEPTQFEVTARIVAETDGPFAEALLANAGRVHGVEVGYFAENDTGLVGRVIQVGRRSSRILKLTDFNSRVPVIGETSGLRAIMFGGRDGRGRLTDQPEAGSFIENERILTSGESGEYPRGVIVGRARDTETSSPNVLLSMQSGQLGFVRLKPVFSILPPEADPDPSQISKTASETKAGD